MSRMNEVGALDSNEATSLKEGAVQDTRMAVKEAQDAMAASFPVLETLAWRFFAISRDLEAGEQSEDFPFEKPGPEHLRWYTASAALAAYHELLESLARARRAVERSELDLFEEWQDRQADEGQEEELQ